MEDDDGGFPLTIPYHYDGEETEREMVAEGDMPDVDEQGDEDEDNDEGKMIINFFFFSFLFSLFFISLYEIKQNQFSDNIFLFFFCFLLYFFVFLLCYR